MKKFHIGFIFIAILALCTVVALSACDKTQDEAEGEPIELVAGKDGDLSMYEVYENTVQEYDKFVIKKVKDEYKEKITTAIIPDSVYCTDWNAFEGCKNLKKVIVQEGVRYLGREAFKDCKKLESIELYDGFSSIYKGTFMNCTSLEEVALPDSVQYIEENAFKGCTALRSIKMSDSVLILGSAFDNTALCDNVIDGMVYINNIAYKYVGNMPKNTTYKLKEGTINAATYAFSDCDGLRHLVLPDSMEYIPSALANRCENLLSLTIGRNFKEINYFTGAWWRVAPVIDHSPRIVEVYNRSDVELTKEFFYTSENGEQMEILHIYDDTGHSGLETRDNGQVYLVTDTAKVLVECAADSDYVQVEDGTTYIRSSSLIDYAIVSKIVLPQSVTKIEMYCREESFQIQYAGTMAQWNAIDKTIDNYIVYCADGTLDKSINT